MSLFYKKCKLLNFIFCGALYAKTKDENQMIKGISSAKFQQMLNLLLGAGFNGTITMK